MGPIPTVTTIISHYNPTYTSDKKNITTYKELPFLVRHILKHNVLIIVGGINAHKGKDKNSKFCLPSSNKSSEYIAEFSYCYIITE